MLGKYRIIFLLHRNRIHILLDLSQCLDLAHIIVAILT